MGSDFFELGIKINENDLSIERLLRINKALKSHPCFSIQGYICLKTSSNVEMEGIIVECQNDRIPQALLKTILYEERLLIYSSRFDQEAPGVKCLRKNFPKGIHQNLTGLNEPVDLCLSDQTWADQKRSWNAIEFLDKILWWLENFAKNTIHAIDQPLEPPFFSSPITLICPANYSSFQPAEYTLASVTGLDKEKSSSKVFLRFKKINENTEKRFFFLHLQCRHIEHGVINNPPATLGELSDILKKLDLDIWPTIKDEIVRLFRIYKDLSEDKTRLILIITFPRHEARTGRFANFTFAFIVEKGLGIIGLENDFLSKATPASQGLTPVTMLNSEEKTNWKMIPVELANVVMENTNLALSIYNNVSESGFDKIKPLLIGCGSLGGHLLTQFFRMGFNDWVVIDDDYFLPHNIARHFLLNCHYGCSKVEAARHSLGFIADEGTKSIFSFSNASEVIWGEDYCDRNLIIDASTTLSIPRDLSLNPDVPRCVSVFFSPSGLDSVIIAEDKHRHIRLDALEAQYYKWVISQANEDHLASESGVRYATGCRDISGKIPLPYIFIHSGILATQLLDLAQKENASVGIWRIQKSTSAITSEVFNPSNIQEITIDEWKIVVSTDIESSAFEIRRKKLPNETGGIILGYLDRVTSKIYIVDLLQEPLDSQSSTAKFQRGIIGIENCLGEVGRKTNGIVGYIGEWHSHPQGCNAMPSSMDKEQLSWTSLKLDYRDQPALMMIVGESSINFMLQQQP